MITLLFCSGEYIDWGIHQFNTSVERNEPMDNIFLTLATFGDHTLHHLFPTLDHSLIPLLQDIFNETCKEFGLELTPKSFTTIILGQFKQLVRVTPNSPKLNSNLKLNDKKVLNID